MENDMDMENIVGMGVGAGTGGGVGSMTGMAVGDELGKGDGAGVSGIVVGASLGTRGQNSLSGGPRSDCSKEKKTILVRQRRQPKLSLLMLHLQILSSLRFVLQRERGRIHSYL
jgi:hypothetical protein